MRILSALLCFMVVGSVSAQSVTVTARDTTQTVVVSQKGKRITLRLRSGQELSGTVRDATDKLIVLGEVPGREFFDAVIPLEAIEAVLIRAKP